MKIIYKMKNVMIVKFKLPADITDEKTEKIFIEFEEKNNYCLLLFSFGKEYEGFDYFYSLLDEQGKKSFLDILVINDIQVLSVEDFTDDFVDIILGNKLQDFREDLDIETVLFDDIIEHIYTNEITKENVLDKINLLGMDSLNENDYKVLSA